MRSPFDFRDTHGTLTAYNYMALIPRVARVPHTSKAPEACLLRQPCAYAPRYTQEKVGDRTALALLILQARIHAGPCGLAQQDLSPAHDLVGSHGLRPWLHTGGNGRAT